MLFFVVAFCKRLYGIRIKIKHRFRSNLWFGTLQCWIWFPSKSNLWNHSQMRAGFFNNMQLGLILLFSFFFRSKTLKAWFDEIVSMIGYEMIEIYMFFYQPLFSRSLHNVFKLNFITYNESVALLFGVKNLFRHRSVFLFNADRFLKLFQFSLKFFQELRSKIGIIYLN